MGVRTISPNRLTGPLKEVSYFTLTGIANTFTDFFVFNILLLFFPTGNSSFIVGYSMIGFLLANLQSFWINKNWTFKKQGSKQSWDRYASFFLVSLFSLGVNSLTFYLLQCLFRDPSSPLLLNIEKLLASGLGITCNFLGYQKIVFRVTGKISAITNDALCLKTFEGSDAPDLTIVIPAYNEASRMARTMGELISFSRKHPNLEMVIVDDGSTDETSECIKKAYLEMPRLTHYRLKQNWGKGGAVRFGLSRAKGKKVFFCDADLSFPLEQIALLRKELEHADVVVGIRKKTANQPIQRRLLSSLFRILVQKLNLTSVKDTQCGFKGFRRTALAQLLPETECCDFTFDIELLALAKRESLLVTEKNIQWLHQEGSTIRFTHIIQMVYSLLLLRIRLYRLFSREFWLGCILFIFSFLVRLPYLYNVPHFIDEWGEVRLASRIARGEIWPLHNTAHDIGAMYNYLLAFVFTMFGHHLFIPRLLVTLFSAGTVVVTFLLALEWTSSGAAFIAGLLLATNSMHILVTHMAWSNDITPFFVTLATLASIRALKSTEYSSWAYCGFVWALALQTHSSVLAPVIGTLIFLWKETGLGQWLKEPRSLYFMGAFLVGYSNMIVYNIIKPLGSIFWIRHKDYALNRHLSLHTYWINLQNMGIELVRTLASAFPNGTGVMHTVSLVWMYLLIAGILYTLPVIVRSRNVSLLLYIVVASFVIIPLFNNRYVYYISTRYIAYLIPLCYIMLMIGLHPLFDRFYQKLKSFSSWRTSFLAVSLGAVIFLLPLYHFYSYAAHYIQLGEDNSAEYAVVNQIIQLNSDHRPVYIDLGGKQGKAIVEMLQIKGQKSHMAGEQPKVQMVSAVQRRGKLMDYGKWVDAMDQGKEGSWFTLLPSHVKPLTEHFRIVWDRTFYITRANGETAYFIGKVASVGAADER